MQTFDVLQPASHSASPLISETDFTPQKPPSGGEKFGDVMDRALGAPQLEPSSDDKDASALEQSTKSDVTTASNAATPSKKPTKPNKPGQGKQVTNDSTIATMQITVVDVCVPQATPAIKTQIIPQDEGLSKDASETGTTQGKKDATTAKGHGEVSKSTVAQLLMVAGSSLAIPLPSPTPTATPIPATPSKESKGTSNPIPTNPVPTAPTATAKAEALGVVVTPTAEKISEVPHQDGKSEPARPDLKNLEAKGSFEHSENSAPTNGVTAQNHPAPSSDSQSTKGIPLEALNTPAKTNASDAQISKPKASVETPAPAPTDPGGISAAKQYTTMKKAEKTTKVAGQNEQDLPSKPSAGSAELPSTQKVPAHELVQAITKTESTTAVEAPATTRVSANPEPTASAISSAAVPPANASDGRIRVLERTHDIVALHAMRLAQTGSDSLHVVVKPGDGIQLSLELRQNQGGVQVSASLHKGDFQHLNQHWPDLQQRLEARGVRVGSLTTSDNFSGTSHQNFQQNKQQQSSQHDPLYAGAFAEFALAGAISEAPAARAARPTVHRGWETWA